MAIVRAQPGDTTDSLIRKFSRKVISEGILSELKDREFYKKPAIKRQERLKIRSRKRPKII
ncbi:30S ribosomal protein S21 [Candidatus Microgenomates bacterium]|nr:30S ribosomal protein S21 [Candidatus Microgenomates bacterium]